MIGSIIGDIVGSIYEFSNIKTKDFDLFKADCEFTDDSILTIATADWLLHGGNVANYYCRYGVDYPYPMGGYGEGFQEWLIRAVRKPTSKKTQPDRKGVVIRSPLFRYNLKLTGIVNFTRTGFPLCLAGVHLGIPDTILRASASKEGCASLSITGVDTEPSFSMMNCTKTLP